MILLTKQMEIDSFIVRGKRHHFITKVQQPQVEIIETLDD